MARNSRISMLATLVLAVLLLTVSSGNTLADNTPEQIQKGADHILTLQNNDGFWSWPHYPNGSASNIGGPIGMGLLAAYHQTKDPDHLAAAVETGDWIVDRVTNYATVRMSTFDPLFLFHLSQITEDPIYRDTAKENFFGRLADGTYPLPAPYTGDAEGFIQLLQDIRAGNFINLRPWDFAPVAIAAKRLNSEDKELFLQAVKDGVDTITAPSGSGFQPPWWETIGLAGGVWALATLKEDFDPTSGAYADADSLKDLADALVALQGPDGDFPFSSQDVPEGDLQETAYSVLALLAMKKQNQYQDSIDSAAEFLIDAQLASGGWPSFDGGGENVEAEAEALWALSESGFFKVKKDKPAPAHPLDD